MTVRSTPMAAAATTRSAAPADGTAPAAVRTERGNLPLDRIDVRADITGLTSCVEVTHDFVNAFDVPLEAGYVFPLPDRGAVVRARFIADGRVVEAKLCEREAARAADAETADSGLRSAIIEEDRPDVFTVSVGNVLPGERVSVVLSLVCPLTYADGAATFRFPLVVAPRHITGDALAGLAAGDGHADDTAAVPDASRITPPVLLPGARHPVPVTIDIGFNTADPAPAQIWSNLPVMSTADGRIRTQPGQRANEDFVLRLGDVGDRPADSLMLAPDPAGDEGTYLLTVLPPSTGATAGPRDLVLVLDSSGSMRGWKAVAARRIASRIIDSLSAADRFEVLTFADRIDRPAGLPEGLVPATDRHRYRAVEHLARVDAAGDTEMLAPLRRACALLRAARDGAAGDTEGTVVLITDGQVGNEDQLLRELSGDLPGVRLHAVGVDTAVNAGLLHRLTAAGGGHCELVESEDRLDDAMETIHRRVAAPLAHSLAIGPDGLALVEDTVSPVRLPDLLPGVPLVVTGRYRGPAAGSLTVRGSTGGGAAWSTTVAGRRRDSAVVTPCWARAHLRDLEDRYARTPGLRDREILAERIVATSLRFGVLSRFTAYRAADGRTVAEGRAGHRVLQPVEQPAARTSGARTVKLRNAVAVTAATALLLGGAGWALSPGREGSPSATRGNGVVPSGVIDGSATVAGVPAPQVSGKLPNDLTFRTAPEGPPAPPQTPAETVPRDIVTTGSLQMLVADPGEVADRLAVAVTDAGGRVDSRSERSGSSSPVVDLVLRVPADKVESVLAGARKLGAVESMSIAHTDVTTQRVDTDARIAALQTSVDRLRDLMSRAGTVADLLAAESSLTQRQAELDSLRSQRAALHDQISYATINVSLSSKPVAARGGFFGALDNGWHALLSAGTGIILAVGFVLPWTPVLAVLALSTFLVVRRVRPSWLPRAVRRAEASQSAR